MNILRRFFTNTNKPERSSYSWNMLSSVLFGVQSAIMLMVINRTNGLEDAGVFSISYAVASMMCFIADYGVRKYQASDVNEECEFYDYLTSRIITCAAMIIACIAYGIYGLTVLDYSREKFWVLMMVCIVKLVEALNEVFFGRFMQVHRLDVAAKTNSFRIIVGMLIYGLALTFTQNLLFSTIIWAVTVTVGLFASSILVISDFAETRIHFRKDKIKKILVECTPLFIGLFLSLYIGNAPKYAIDALMTDEAQARFNFIFMPVFVVGMLSNFVFNPVMVDLAEAWQAKRYEIFKKIVYRQMSVIAALTVLAVAVALTIGCPVLGMLFHADLADLRMDLTVLMIGGGMLAFTNLLTVVITIIRAQKYFTFGYVGTAVLALLLSNKAVSSYGLMGASVLYAVLMSLMTGLFVIILVICVKKEIRQNGSI